MIRGVVQLVGALVGVIALMIVCTIVIGIFRKANSVVHPQRLRSPHTWSPPVEESKQDEVCRLLAKIDCGGSADNVLAFIARDDGCWWDCTEDAELCREWAIEECGGRLSVERWWIDGGRCHFTCN